MAGDAAISWYSYGVYVTITGLYVGNVADAQNVALIGRLPPTSRITVPITVMGNQKETLDDRIVTRCINVSHSAMIVASGKTTQYIPWQSIAKFNLIFLPSLVVLFQSSWLENAWKC